MKNTSRMRDRLSALALVLLFAFLPVASLAARQLDSAATAKCCHGRAKSCCTKHGNRSDGPTFASTCSPDCDGQPGTLAPLALSLPAPTPSIAFRATANQAVSLALPEPATSHYSLRQRPPPAA